MNGPTIQRYDSRSNNSVDIRSQFYEQARAKGDWDAGEDRVRGRDSSRLFAKTADTAQWSHAASPACAHCKGLCYYPIPHPRLQGCILDKD